ncbi:MAG: Glycosyl transferase, family 2 [Parcubacteria group bacterium GW2011_GWA2_40_23]|nr:MAG: Glycosyl transferase, family 2 [Parcubacteria group bacterium GW2011_GWA2_40_23]
MPVNKSLVTISIPTYNSEKFLGLCLDAIAKQTYSSYEINLVDGGSKDRTLKIAKEKGITNITFCKESLLKSRYEGVKSSNGKFILLLDSDQVLEPKALELLVNEVSQNDMIVLGEDVYKKETFLEKLFSYDRKLVHLIKDFNPKTSVMLPRFYRKEILLKAFEAIPDEVLNSVGGQDHAIIYYEAYLLSSRVTMIPNLVRHIEPSKIIPMLKKFYRWGYTSVGARNTRYSELLARKEHFRTGLFRRGLLKESVASILLLLIKGLPYKLGYLIAKGKNK